MSYVEEQLKHLFQSTHPCGVRRGAFLLHSPPIPFQSTHPCGVRLAIVAKREGKTAFQSTHPCGVRRHGGVHHIKYRSRFNPRTPAGCDAH